MSTLLIRFSSLGDVALSAGITGSLGGVIYVTHQRYAPLVRRFSGVEEVLALQPGEALSSLRARLPPDAPAVDLHGSLRSRALCLGRTTRRVRGLRLARRLRVSTKRPERVPTLLSRYAEAAGVEPAPRPWIPLGPRGRALGLAPGAAHATKRWPAERFAALGQAWGGEVLVFGSEAEAPLLSRVARACGGEVIAERGFDRTLEGLARCAAFASGDSGLLHLAAACGLPVLGLFGPTHSADGFWCHPGEALELPLPCRPCSRFGGPRCPIGDHLCLRGLEVQTAVEALARLAAP